MDPAEALRAKIKSARADLEAAIVAYAADGSSRTKGLKVGQAQSAVDELMAEYDAKGYGKRQVIDDDAANRAAGVYRTDTIKTFKSADKMADYVKGTDPGMPDVGLGTWLKALVTGEWGDVPPAIKAMSIGTPSAGGYLVPTPTAGRVIDLARNASRVVQAGAVTVPMTASTLKVPKLITDPTSGWKAENADATSSDLAFDSVEFEAHTLVALASLSVELAEDGQDVNNVVERSMAAALGTELDRAALYGTGSNDQPTGVANTSGIETINVSTGLPGDYSDYSLAVERIRENNLEPNAAIHGPKVAGILDRLTDTTGQPLQPPESYRNLTKLVTNQVTPLEAFVGDWTQLMIGLRTNIVIEASREASDAAGSAFRSLRVLVRAYLRADVQLAHPGAFCYLTQFAEGS